MMSNIVIGDYTKVSFNTPESTRQSVQWTRTDSPKLKGIQAHNINQDDCVCRCSGTDIVFLHNLCPKVKQSTLCLL